MTSPADPSTQGINSLNITKKKKKYDRHNYAKFKLLHQCIKMQKDGLVINSVRLSHLLKKPMQNVCSMLYHLSNEYPYLKEQIDPDKTDGCIKKYSVAKQGKSVYKKLIVRYNHGLDLNLKRKYPQPVKFTERN